MKKRRVGRYVVFEPFARGGMASVHLGRLLADRGFSKLVAIKMAAWSASKDNRSWHARALEEEARIASRIRHPNVVQPLDFVVDGDDLLVVMEYVHGVALADLARIAATQGTALPYPVTVAIFLDVLRGLHAAHEATDELGRPLGVVHRDVSPQNVLVGEDGIARLADFGIAKVMRSTEHTETGIVKGKLGYMPPEQLRGFPLTRQADLFSAGAVLAEILTGIGPTPADEDPTAWLVDARDAVAVEPLREVVRVATSPDARDRYATAAEMATALDQALNPARPARNEEITATVTTLAGDELDLKRELVRRVEAANADDEADDGAPADAEPELVVPPPEPAAPRPRRRGRVRRALFFLSGTAVALLAVFALRRTRPSDAAPPPPAPPPVWPISPPAANEPATPAPATIESSPPAPAKSAVSVAAPVPSIASPRLLKTPRRTSSGPTGGAPATTNVRPSTPDCQPPFRIDAEGKKHYKPECVE